MLTVLVVLNVVAECLHMRDRVIQNRRKSARLLNVLEAIQAPLRTIEAAEEGSKVVHESTLARIQSAVNEAKTLLERQTVVSSYGSKLFASRSVERQFEDVRRNILAHTQALTLSVTVMGRMASNELLQMAIYAVWDVSRASGTASTFTASIASSPRTSRTDVNLATCESPSTLRDEAPSERATS